MSKLVEIVASLGGHVYDGGKRALVPGPGHSKQDLSLSLWLNGDGRVIFFSHAGDTTASVFAHLSLEALPEDGLNASQRAKAKKARQEAEARLRAEKMRFCRRVWDSSVAAEGTLAQHYLNRDRGIPIRRFPTVVRFCPAAPWSYDPDSRKPPSPALVALGQDNLTGDVVGIHVTYLSTKGGHHGRLMFGNMRGAAVRLHEASEELAVAEGLETAWSYSFLHERPTWALLSTSQFKSFRPPIEVDHLWVAPDMDDKLGTSLILAKDMTVRLPSHRPSLKVTVDAPPPDTDWNKHHRNIQGLA